MAYANDAVDLSPWSLQPCKDELRETSNGGNSCGGRNCITVDEAFTRVRVRSVYEEHEDLQSRRHVMSDVDVRDHRTRLRLRVSGQDGG
ncbi:hypothetical protein F2P81_008346 [Scophthalmus maximus]|uniref:Uncharacterized protein n=1 Tax=Scophthalmus maximus TaxID=52904 RepID=A0A6A4TB06_SCOMX|nr:hypothetical protein F2P81_008346 [Scophthalmus maximus]